jgi:hypothetical protein
MKNFIVIPLVHTNIENNEAIKASPMWCDLMSQSEALKLAHDLSMKHNKEYVVLEIVYKTSPEMTTKESSMKGLYNESNARHFMYSNIFSVSASNG